MECLAETLLGLLQPLRRHAQLCFGPLARGDVDAGTQRVRHAVDVDEFRRKQHGVHDAVLRSHIHFEVTHAAFSVELGAINVYQLRVHPEFQIERRPAQDLIAAVAEHAGESVVGLDDHAFRQSHERLDRRAGVEGPLKNVGWGVRAQGRRTL